MKKKAPSLRKTGIKQIDRKSGKFLFRGMRKILSCRIRQG